VTGCDRGPRGSSESPAGHPSLRPAHRGPLVVVARAESSPGRPRPGGPPVRVRLRVLMMPVWGTVEKIPLSPHALPARFESIGACRSAPDRRWRPPATRAIRGSPLGLGQGTADLDKCVIIDQGPAGAVSCVPEALRGLAAAQYRCTTILGDSALSPPVSRAPGIAGCSLDSDRSCASTRIQQLEAGSDLGRLEQYDQETTRR
jgi:hypothetical protein